MDTLVPCPKEAGSVILKCMQETKNDEAMVLKQEILISVIMLAFLQVKLLIFFTQSQVELFQRDTLAKLDQIEEAGTRKFFQKMSES